MKNYEINEDTLALIEQHDHTKVYEKNNVFYINQKPNEIMEKSCEYFGSSLLGRQKGTINLIGVSHKSPIIVQEEDLLIFFPTASPRLNNCSWISTKEIKKYYKDHDKVVIEYENGTKITIDVSFGIIDNQILRSALLEKAILNRKKFKKKFKNG